MSAFGNNIFYCNGVSVSFIPVDVVIHFTFTTFAALENGPKAELRVHMSPLMAKILARVLSEAVARYEGEVGPLPEVNPAAGEAARLQ